MKRRPGSVYTFHRDLSLHHLQQMIADGQPQAASFDRTVAFHIQPLEHLVKLILIFFPDTAAGIFHGDIHQDLIVRIPFSINGKPHAALFGIFDRIIQQIGQDLLQSKLIPVQSGRQFFGNIYAEG